MQNKTYTLSLSRWHTVANRLKAHAEALADNAQKALAHTTAQHELTDAQRAALAKRGAQALQDIQDARSTLRASAHVRAQLAQANAEQGVSAKLAEAEGVRREIQFLAQLQEIDLLSKVSLDDANRVLAKRAADGGSLSARLSAVSLSIVDIDALDAHARDKTILERQQQEMMDEVNTLNRNTLSIDLDSAIAQHAGL